MIVVLDRESAMIALMNHHCLIWRVRTTTNCKVASSSIISQPGEALRVGIVGSMRVLTVFLENENRKSLLTVAKLCYVVQLGKQANSGSISAILTV